MNIIITLFKDYGLSIGLVALVVFTIYYFSRILLDEDRSALWRARFYKMAFSVLHKQEHEKKYIANDINGKINLARRDLHFGEEILPKAVKVEWIEGKNGETYDLKEGEFVVCLNPANCQEMNIVKLASAVVKRTTLIGARHILEKPLIGAIDLNLTRNLLDKINNRKSLDWFFAQEYQPVIKNDPKLSEWNGKIATIEEKGLFTRILLIELTDFAKKIAGLLPRAFMGGEVESLIDFLYKIATKPSRQPVPLDFERAYIRTGIMLVADTDKMLLKGIVPYIKGMSCKLEKMLNTVYLIVFDKAALGERDPKLEEEFNSIVKNLDETILGHSLIKKDFEVSYKCIDSKGKKRKAKCIRYSIEYN